MHCIVVIIIVNVYGYLTYYSVNALLCNVQSKSTIDILINADNENRINANIYSFGIVYSLLLRDARYYCLVEVSWDSNGLFVLLIGSAYCKNSFGLFYYSQKYNV